MVRSMKRQSIISLDIEFLKIFNVWANDDR